MVFKRKLLIVFTATLALGLLLPGRGAVPVENASNKDWNANSFWHEPWGKSGVHKGIDIFAPKGTRVISSSYGLVIFTGNIKLGGNVVAVLGPKWRIHYYAHLQNINAKTFDLAGKGDIIGSVGDSGNAKGKPPHLHYSVFSLLPYPWRFSSDTRREENVFYESSRYILLTSFAYMLCKPHRYWLVECYYLHVLFKLDLNYFEWLLILLLHR